MLKPKNILIKVLSPKNNIKISINHVRRYADVFNKLFPNNPIAKQITEMAADIANITEYIYYNPDKMQDFSFRDSVQQREYSWNLEVEKLRNLHANKLNDYDLAVLIIMIHNVDVLKYQRVFMKQKKKRRRE